MEGKHTSRAVFERLGLSSKMEGCSHDCGCDESRRGSKGILKYQHSMSSFVGFFLSGLPLLARMSQTGRLF